MINNTEIQLTSQQKEVFNKVENFLKSDAQVFILKGYAGTGKTTMVKEIAEYIHNDLHKNPQLMAPTGRAARVLSDKTNINATTIHKRIYDFESFENKDEDNIEESERKLIFAIKETESNPIAIVDEASMISSTKSEQELYQFGTGVLLTDLLTYIKPLSGGKIIFVGDPAQLPPVGDNQSRALSEDYFKSQGLKVESAELTGVLRQGGQSFILKNAMKIRDLLKETKRNRLSFEKKDGEVEDIQPSEVTDKYMKEGADPADGKCVIIAYSNHIVAGYNHEIRLKKYGKEMPLKVGDSLMVVKNDYALSLMNGEFIKVIGVGGVESQSAPVYVSKGGKRERDIIKIDFQDVTIQDSFGNNKTCKIILTLLDNDRPSLSVNEQNALFINFRIRHNDLKPRSKEFNDALIVDPYYNALQVKYGYAITGHKCQGGEWETVFVDYEGRSGLSDDSLRWNYTATTRAQKTLYITNLPDITPFDKFRIDNIAKVKNVDAEFRVYSNIIDSPFHTKASPDFLRAKYECIKRNLEFTPYKIQNVLSRPYLERYTISTPDGTEVYNLTYKGSGLFLPAKTTSLTENSNIIKQYLDDERYMPTVCKYIPSDEPHKLLYDYIQTACDELGIKISNIVEHNDKHYTMFYFNTSNTISYLQVFINDKGFITYGKPASILGNDDSEFVKLINALRL